MSCLESGAAQNSCAGGENNPLLIDLKDNGELRGAAEQAPRSGVCEMVVQQHEQECQV